MSSKIPVFPYSPTIDIGKHANVNDQFSQLEIDELNNIINSLDYEEGRIVNEVFLQQNLNHISGLFLF
jgi:hypothetical protein